MKKNHLNISWLAYIMVGMLVVVTSCKKDKDVAVTDINLNKTSTSVAIGATDNLSAVITPSDATSKDLTWRSSNTAIATVADGLVTGVALGNTKIIVMSKADTTKRDTCDVTVTPVTGQVITISGDITSDQKWYAVAKYKLSGFVFVKNNATITIEPGTVIQGVSGTKAALIIERGSKIMAQGTAQKPIVFTSDKAKGARNYGDWGGLVLCGKAKTNKHDDGTGIGKAEGGIDSRYGGDVDNDNSGVLQYVRIEFAGIALASTANSEINGLTLYAVGNGTTIDHVQVSYAGDDSYEWFGGTVNCKYLVAWRGWDDDFDTDNGFTGAVQFIVSVRDGGMLGDQSGSNGFESDNDADGSLLTPTTKPTFSNASVFGPLSTAATLQANHLWKRGMQIRRSSQCSVYNSLFVGWPKGLIIDGALGNTPTKAEDNTLQIENTILAGMQANYEAASGTPATPYTTTQIQAYFEAAARNNNATATLTDILGSNLLSLTAPSFIPANGSTLLTGASFTNTRLSGNSFITTVTYRGAFGTTDWTAGWCNFDPQNADY